MCVCVCVCVCRSLAGVQCFWHKCRLQLVGSVFLHRQLNQRGMTYLLTYHHGNERLTTNQNQRHQVCSPRQRGVGLRVGSGHEGGGACLTSGATPTSDDEHSKFFISLSLHSHLIKKA